MTGKFSAFCFPSYIQYTEVGFLVLLCWCVLPEVLRPEPWPRVAPPLYSLILLYVSQHRSLVRREFSFSNFHLTYKGQRKELRSDSPVQYLNNRRRRQNLRSTPGQVWAYCAVILWKFDHCVGNLSPAMEVRNQIGIGLSYRPASLCSLATQFQTRFLESIPRPMAGLKFSTLYSIPPVLHCYLWVEELTHLTSHQFLFPCLCLCHPFI